MKTASVRELRQDFPRILEWINDGEEVEITRRREAVARLIPVRRKKSKAKMPDIGGRLKKVFGNRTISERQWKALMEENKGAF